MLLTKCDILDCNWTCVNMKYEIMLKILLFLLTFDGNLAVIYKVNESEYNKMPPLFAMDSYAECMEYGGVYCLADYDLYSKDYSELLNFIKEYSDHKIKHFNHTVIHRGTCVTKCISHLNHTLETTPDLKRRLEECVNETIWEKYKIETKLTKFHYCKRFDEKIILDATDFVIAAVYAIILILNIIGSFYDIIICQEDNKKGNPYLLAFSLKRNWAKLVAPGGRGSDPRFERLKFFNGLRPTDFDPKQAILLLAATSGSTGQPKFVSLSHENLIIGFPYFVAMTMVCVIFSHTALIMSATYVENPLYLERAYNDPLKQILYNGSLVTHTFFVMSSFLLAFNLQVQAEKREITWSHIPTGIIFRWIRLTPPYFLIIASICTWVRHSGTGPLWDLIVTHESNVCRQYWWANIFYFNNYIYPNDDCFPQGWYLAADTQLFVFALILFVIIQSPRYRKIILITLLLASIVITSAHTYFENLDAVVIQSPESYRSFYVHDDTFNLVYIRGHTNLSTYVLGLAAGLLCYKWQTEEKDMSKYKKYRIVIWLLFPLAVAIILSGGFFYIDDYTPSAFVIVTYASLYKPLFQLCVVMFILSVVFKLESVYRGIVEWRGFAWTGRVSYCAFLLHTIFQRTYIGSQTATLIMSDYSVLILLSASIFLSFLCGAGLWLLVEAPVAGLTKALLAKKKE